MKSGTNAAAEKAVRWMIDNRQGSGTFGSTQATILALKALIAHATESQAKITDGELLLKLDEQEIGRQPFQAGRLQTIEIPGIQGHLKTGDNVLTVDLTGENQMPYVIDVRYRSWKPDTDERCPIRLATKLKEPKIASGATVPLEVKLENISGVGQPMTLAVVGLPAGLEASTRQLDRLRDQGRFDYYESQGRELVFYWRSVAPDARKDQAHRFTLDLVGEVPGKYAGPASRTYLYYTPEMKYWVDPLTVEIVNSDD